MDVFISPSSADREPAAPVVLQSPTSGARRWNDAFRVTDLHVRVDVSYLVVWKPLALEGRDGS